MCKSTSTFQVPPAVVAHSAKECRRLSFRRETKISSAKVRRYDASQNPQGFGESVVYLHSNKGSEGTIAVRGNITDETVVRELAKNLVLNLDEVREHDLVPTLSFEKFTPLDERQSVDRAYFSFKRDAGVITGIFYFVNGRQEVVLNGRFSAKRALITAELPTPGVGTSGRVLQQPALAGATGT